MRFTLQSFVYDVLLALVAVYRNPHGPVRFAIVIGPSTPRHVAARKDRSLMAFILPNTHKVALAVRPVDIAGNPAQVDGVPIWASSDPTIVRVEPAPDGLSAVAFAEGPLGTVQVNVTADADLGEGLRELTALLEIEVRASEAIALEITTGEAEPK